MEGEKRWRELHRFTDGTAEDAAAQAQRVVVSLAAMEFDARVRSMLVGACEVFLVEVLESDYPVLVDVLPEIIQEQDEFDQRMQERATRWARLRMMVVIIIAALMLILGLLGLPPT